MTASTPGAGRPDPEVVTHRPKTHPRYTLDEVIHSPVRLSIMAALARVEEMNFADLRAVVEVSDSLLSKHIRQLEDRGYVVVTKGYIARRPRTWFTLSESGRTAFARYRATLHEILDQPEPAMAATSPSGRRGVGAGRSGTGR